uniref:Exported protein n=1 Tax=Parastrongyloides trichosuri TaxID=131310 RepID=A0A0N4ZSB9_PARTI
MNYIFNCQKPKLYNLQLLLLLFFLTIIHISQCELLNRHPKESAKMNKEFYNFNLSNVNNYFHKAAISALIKSKAKKILKDLPKVEEVVFWQCTKEAKKLNHLAKCAVSLFNIRDRVRAEQKDILPLKNKTTVEKRKNIFTSTFNEIKYDNDIRENKKILRTTMYNITLEHNHVKRKFHRIRRPNSNYREEKYNKLKKVEIKNELFRRRRVKKETNYIDINQDNHVIDEDFINEIEMARKKEQYLPQHLNNLKRLERFTKMSEYVDKYVERMNKHNEDMITKLYNPLKFKMKKLNNEDKYNQGFFDKIIDIVNDLLQKKQKFSFLSPQLFNIIPPCGSKCKQKNKLLSPSIFSFHEEDGYLTLPNIMKSAINNDIEQNQWLNLLLEVSGASNALQKAVDKLMPQIIEMENKIFPAIVNAERIEYKYKNMLKMYDREQLESMKTNGYTFLREDQLKAMHWENLPIISQLPSMTKNDLEMRLEHGIKQLASLEDNPNNQYNTFLKKINKHRIKRQGETGATATEDPEAEGTEEHEVFVTLEPFAFFNRIGEPVSMEIITLSPHAFILELLSPETLTVQTLSPRAFIATILSPNALVARILSPGFFRAEILSPRALTAWVLSPDFLFVEILSPKFIEPRILSPEYLQVQVLSPTFISPRVLSQEGMGILVLSPNILSPNILSRESLIVEILSPHIFGGHEHTESGESAEGEFTGEHHVEGHRPHGHHSEFHPIHIHTYPFSHKQIPHSPYGEREGEILWES